MWRFKIVVFGVLVMGERLFGESKGIKVRSLFLGFL